jgi:hypothetical protein
VVDSSKVEHAADEAHNTHVRLRHALRPRVRHKQAERQEITLCRIEIDTPGCASSSAE